MAKKRHYAEFYAGPDARRAEEIAAGDMIHEDRSAIANLPQQQIMREYPKSPAGLGGYLDDTITGIDSQMAYDNRKAREGMGGPRRKL